MNCLHCGDCCLRMSPLSAPEPCQHIDQRGNFYFCLIYQNRPEECINHTFYSQYCPIGMSKLEITNSEQARQRMDAGFALLRFGGSDINKAINLLYKHI